MTEPLAVVRLTESELRHVAMIGADRRIAAMMRGRTEPYGTPTSDLWGNDVESSGAEYAVAKATSRFWNVDTGGSLVVTPPDVGQRIQVRSTHHENGHLPVYEKDDDDHFFFLVVGRLPSLVVVGYIKGRDAKVDRFRRETPRGTTAYWVDQANLRRTPCS